MLTAEASVQTEHSSRYLVQLCRHASSINHKILRIHAGKAWMRPEIQDIEWSDTHGTLTFSWGRCTLQAEDGTLTVRAEAADEENLQRTQDLITRNLERFGRRDHLKVNWRRPQAPVAPGGEAGQPRPPRTLRPDRALPPRSGRLLASRREEPRQHPRTDWVMSSGLTGPGGVRLSDQAEAQAMLAAQAAGGSSEYYLRTHGYGHWARLEPASRSWHVQILEASVYAALALCCLTAAVLVLRRQPG